jgi:hypothetical protein
VFMSAAAPLGIAIPAKSNEEKGEPISVTVTRERRPLRDTSGADAGPVSGLSGLADYARLDKTMLGELARRYHNDPVIRLVSESVKSRVFSGKVRIQHTGDDDDDDDNEGKEEKKKKAKSKLLDDQYSQIWSNWGTRIIEQQDMWGFAVATFVSDPIHGFVPCVLNLLDGIEVRHRVNKFSEQLFAFYQQPAASTGLGPSSLPLPNVYVFCLTPPGMGGEIRSNVAALMPTILHLERMQQFDLLAHQKRSNPVVMTEHVDYPWKADALPPEPSRYPVATPKEERSLILLDRIARHANAFGVASPSTLLDKADAVLALLSSSTGAPVHDLEYGRKYVAPQLAEPPVDIDRLRLSYQQLVMMQWGMPPGVYQPESTHGKIGQSETAKKIFDENIRTIKDRVGGYIADMYHIIWDRIHMERKILSTSIDESLTDHKLFASTHVEVSIPGRPSEEVFLRLHREGSLKWKYYRQLQSSIHCIPLDAFEEEQKLSLLDLLTEGGESIERIKGSIAAANREKEVKLEGVEDRKTEKAKPKPKQQPKKRKT